MLRILNLAIISLFLASYCVAHNPNAKKKGDHAGHDHDHDHDECAHEASDEVYDLMGHIWSIALVVVVSLVGSMTPIVVNTNRYRFLLQCGTMFGAGTILGTFLQPLII
jgi:hypothetical protein